MKLKILSILAAATLLLAGSAIAQTQDTSATAPPADTSVTQGTTGSPSGSTIPSPVPSDGSSYNEAGTATQPSSQTADPATTSGMGTRDSLPRTASDIPLLFALGVIGAGSLLAMRLYRTRDAG